ncbi:MAG: helix-turn-helix transcriptional regulator [Acidobacteria bacterium]|nr:helix-turn-helix transcriptional regulator [Acidobacteriota bacterium]MBS1867823.1 helix-turn-helix transcriptional regulator [Acidobacteriota bacterium]
MIDERQFFRALGARLKKLRKGHRYTQEDMIGFGFSARHWQQIEAGRPITIRTLLKISRTFGISASRLIEGLDRGMYRKA